MKSLRLILYACSDAVLHDCAGGSARKRLSGGGREGGRQRLLRCGIDGLTWSSQEESLGTAGLLRCGWETVADSLVRGGSGANFARPATRGERFESYPALSGLQVPCHCFCKPRMNSCYDLARHTSRQPVESFPNALHVFADFRPHLYGAQMIGSFIRPRKVAQYAPSQSFCSLAKSCSSVLGSLQSALPLAGSVAGLSCCSGARQVTFPALASVHVTFLKAQDWLRISAGLICCIRRVDGLEQCKRPR